MIGKGRSVRTAVDKEWVAEELHGSIGKGQVIRATIGKKRLVKELRATIGNGWGIRKKFGKGQGWRMARRIFSTIVLLAFVISSAPLCAAAPVTLSEEEQLLTATLVYYETQGEPLLSKVCFCAMLLNRLKSPLFPDTAREMIFDVGAFESAMEGKLSALPHKDSLSCELFILKQVLERGLDPTCDSLFTMKTDDPCLWELTVLFTVDDRVFGILK